ncbi:hypothetical protein FBBAL38_09674 [Flavobacteria bacterium BAL38]|nr:hypothetical protein FBBAL38_09674 [Flavobacteria bacterium BAL38]
MYITLMFFFILISCSKDEVSKNADIATPIDNLSTGSGLFTFTYNVVSFNKTMNIYYYIPENKTASTPILFVFHGTERNASDYRNTLITKAQLLGFIVIAPEFSEQNFPGGDGYNLGNVFIDGDNPSASSLNPESEWTFSIIEPLFDFVKTQINNTNGTYYMFGHSAGGQFVHRFLMFNPIARVEKAVVSASGWYTFPTNTIVFPYGTNQSPLENMSSSLFFDKKVYVQVGENDDDPNAAGLRHNSFADAQGLNRKERAINYFQFCEQLATTNAMNFNWTFRIVSNANHDYNEAAENAVSSLFN